MDKYKYKCNRVNSKFWKLILLGTRFCSSAGKRVPITCPCELILIHTTRVRRLITLLHLVKLTGTFHALVYEAIQQRATVVTEGGTGVSLDLKCVSTLQVLKFRRNFTEDPHTHTCTHPQSDHEINCEHTHVYTHPCRVWLVERCWAGVFMDKPIRFLHGRGHTV